jgi:Tol biopolymer transport system component
VAVPPWDIWRVPARQGSVIDRSPERVISSSRNDENPAYSPDGRRIAFESSRGGPTNIWVSDSDGANPVQVTSFTTRAGTPNWAPDGRRLVFDSVEEGNWNLYVVDADGGRPQQLTHEPSGGPATQMTKGGGTNPRESSDGRSLYFTRGLGRSGIWRMPTSGGEGTEVWAAAVERHGDWDLSPRGLYAARNQIVLPWRRWTSSIWFLDLETRQVTQLVQKEGPAFQWLAVSPDDEWLLYSEQAAWTSELMLVENFR